MRNIYNTSFLFAGRLDLLFLFKVIHGFVTLPSGVCPAFYVAVHAMYTQYFNVGRKEVQNYYQNSYFIRVAKLWNILPSDLTLEKQTLRYFKDSLCLYYIITP